MGEHAKGAEVTRRTDLDPGKDLGNSSLLSSYDPVLRQLRPQ